MNPPFTVVTAQPSLPSFTPTRKPLPPAVDLYDSNNTSTVTVTVDSGGQ